MFIMKTGFKYFHILFLLILVHEGLVAVPQNIAFGKVATSSSTGYNSPPEKVIDGDSNNGKMTPGGACAHTNKEASWISIDLGSEYEVSSVNLVGRAAECDCHDQSSDWKIRIGNSNSIVDSLCKENVDVYGGQEVSIHCNTDLSGRHVRIESETWMVLCEIMIFGDEKTTKQFQLQQKQQQNQQQGQQQQQSQQQQQQQQQNQNQQQQGQQNQQQQQQGQQQQNQQQQNQNQQQQGQQGSQVEVPYFIMDEGKSCPVGSEITTQDDCNEALKVASELGIDLQSRKQLQVGSFPNAPYQCSFLTSGDQAFHFNHDANTNSNRLCKSKEFRMICRACPENYVAQKGHCYGFETESLKRSDARKRCCGGKCLTTGNVYDLVIVNNKEENDFLVKQIQTRFNGQQFWINLRENEAKDSFFWTDGTKFEFGSNLYIDPWMGSQPDELGGSKRECVRFHESGKWADRTCETKYGSICEGLMMTPLTPTEEIVCTTLPPETTTLLESCNDGDVSLGADGTPYLFWGGSWSPICGHWFWNNQHGAKAFCQKLGFSGGSLNKENLEYCEDSIEIGACNSGDAIDSCTGGSSGSKYSKTGWCQTGNQVKITITCNGNTENSELSSCTERVGPAPCPLSTTETTSHDQTITSTQESSTTATTTPETSTTTTTAKDPNRCDEIPTLKEGDFECENSELTVGTKCKFVCPSDKVPVLEDTITCDEFIDPKSNLSTFEWDKEISSFECVKIISMVLGGIDKKYSYLDDIELYAPDLPCHQNKLPKFPHKVVGAVGGFVGRKKKFIYKKVLICGGATHTYTDCAQRGERERSCDRNTECVLTKGGAEWCFGPKTKDCFIYNPSGKKELEKWTKVATLKVPRAFAASVPLKDGRLWILGGLGAKTILQSTEILQENMDGTWKVTRGPDLPRPLFGHCATTLPNGNILLAGGFDGLDQSRTTAEFQWNGEHDGKWINELWTDMLDQRYDHSCFVYEGSAYALGGWKENIAQTMKPEKYNSSSMKWETISDDWKNGLPDILRSFSVGTSEGKLALLGGVSCETGRHIHNGRKCNKRSEIYEFEPLQGWMKSDNKLMTSRSSHVSINIPVILESSCN